MSWGLQNCVSGWAPTLSLSLSQKALKSLARWPLLLVYSSVGLNTFVMKSYVLSILSAVLFVAGVSAQGITLNTLSVLPPTFSIHAPSPFLIQRGRGSM